MHLLADFGIVEEQSARTEMSVPNDRYEREPRYPAERLLTQFTPQERGLAAAALVAFLGITYLGPALTRLMTPKSRARKLREAATEKARDLRRRGSKGAARARSTIDGLRSGR